jgi:hypothetical protein
MSLYAAIKDAEAYYDEGGCLGYGNLVEAHLTKHNARYIECNRCNARFMLENASLVQSYVPAHKLPLDEAELKQIEHEYEDDWYDYLY